MFAVIFISHKLEEVIRSSHSIVVMRDGEHVGTRLSKETDALELSKLIVGRSIAMDTIGHKR